jgi:hypothetical protein
VLHDAVLDVQYLIQELLAIHSDCCVRVISPEWHVESFVVVKDFVDRCYDDIRSGSEDLDASLFLQVDNQFIDSPICFRDFELSALPDELQ